LFIAPKFWIEKSIQELIKNFGCDWGFLNFVDLKAKRSTIYTPSKGGQEILRKVLNCKFDNNWATLEKPLLRKQIMAKLNNL